MNFFQHQEAARKKTGRLVLLFALAVALIIGLIYLVVGFVYAAQHTPEGQPLELGDLWNAKLFVLTVIGVGLVIAAGSFYRIATLGAGGKTVAEMLGGRLIGPGSTDWRERRLLNVVEEMALASGMPVPAVYVMDGETGVNAFAAGFTPGDAVVAVTRGTMETLTRDELQGVIAHEFSHIFNGDMRLNVRLMGVLHGILLISLIGYVLFRIALEIRPSRSSSSSNDKNSSAAGIMLVMLGVGIALYILGYIGVFFGHLIKSAVSRQREYLADASAVQFTRNPQGITGALRKIGALGSRLANNHAEQASHMFFGNGVKPTFLALTATHPPLVDRIRRIDPTFDGDFSKEKLPWPEEAKEKAAMTRPATGAAAVAASAAFAGPVEAPAVAAPLRGRRKLSAQQAVADVGAPQAEHLEFAAALLDNLPAPLMAEIHDPIGAACTVYALLLQADPSDDEPELRKLEAATDGALADRVRRIVALIQPLPVEMRLPLAQLTMTALRQLTPAQYDRFRRLVVMLIRADEQISLFEFGIHRMILKHLAEHFEPRPPVTVAFDQVGQVARPASVVLSTLAHAGHHGNPSEAAESYAAGRAVLNERPAAAPLSVGECGFVPLEESLDALGRASPPVKHAILAACAACVGRDGTMTIDEGELLRTIAGALDCPMPPPAAMASPK
jgi:Zn-dependent protease with chaperone function